MGEALRALLRSRKFLFLCLGTVISLMLYFAARYAGPSLAEDVKMIVGLLQLPVTAIIVASLVEDSAAKKAGTFLTEKK
jgi:uncharacterized membrane protein